MTIAAKLSRKFYDRFGEDVANELVDLLNVIAANYKSDLREINDVSWTRFDAKLEQRLAEVRADVRMDIQTLSADMKTLKAEVRGDLKALETRLIKWMFVFLLSSALLTQLSRLLGWLKP